MNHSTSYFQLVVFNNNFSPDNAYAEVLNLSSADDGTYYPTPNQKIALVGPKGPTGPSGLKTFVIEHPLDLNKYLVHACLEGPEAGVYYRGKGEITNNESTIIELPDYVSKLASNFTIQITTIYNKQNPIMNNYNYSTSEIENNNFTVYGSNGTFYWLVQGERCKVNVEPLKELIILKGDGPYKWF